MNYATVRGIIVIIAIVIFIVLFVEVLQKKKKWVRILSGIIVILFIGVLSFLPFENLFYGFTTPEESFYYTFPNQKIVHKEESGDLAVIFYDDETMNAMILEKGERGWKIYNATYSSNSFIFKDYLVAVKPMKHKEKALIYFERIPGTMETKQELEELLHVNYNAEDFRTFSYENTHYCYTFVNM